MELQHVNVKVPVDGPLPFDEEAFIPVFHEWIRTAALPGLLIDVADYRHVPGGPGVMLIAREGDYSMDHGDACLGLRYNRKLPLEGSNEERLRQALGAALTACSRLESQFSDLRFSRERLDISINDRALAPNTAETFEACRGELQSFLERALGHADFTVEREGDPRSLFRVTVKSRRPGDLAAMLGRC